MATITKLPSGSWRPGQTQGILRQRDLLRRGDGEAWTRNVEGKIDRGEPIHLGGDTAKTFKGLIDLHKEDLADVGKTLERSKAASLEFLASRFGKLKPAEFSREKLIEFRWQRAKEDAGPVTVGHRSRLHQDHPVARIGSSRG